MDEVLQQSMVTMDKWKESFQAVAGRLRHGMPEKNWDFIDHSSFALVDAFVQRCQDLQEISAASKQFGFKSQLMYLLSGPKATELCRTLTEVQDSFTRLMER